MAAWDRSPTVVHVQGAQGDDFQGVWGILFQLLEQLFAGCQCIGERRWAAIYFLVVSLNNVAEGLLPGIIGW